MLKSRDSHIPLICWMHMECQITGRCSSIYYSRVNAENQNMSIAELTVVPSIEDQYSKHSRECCIVIMIIQKKKL